MHHYSIIIPTRNRMELLLNLLSKINLNDSGLVEVIVVDSSDVSVIPQVNNPKIKYILTNIKSAAIQRNIGIKNLKDIRQNVFFVDDDVILPNDYFIKLNELLLNKETVGVSGLAINNNRNLARIESKGIKGIYRRIFLLDSKHEGVLLKSAVNIPVHIKQNVISSGVNVEWLIGCSAWKSTVFAELRFEEKFDGQSLGEDVLFSNKARKMGKLMVDTTVILNHLESEIERPNLWNFYVMWVSNRYEISKQLELSLFNIAFHWANIGKIIITLIRWDLDQLNKRSIIRGIIAGYCKILFGSK